MNLISFSLYGTKELYLCGAIENTRLALKLFPQWQVVFYVGSSVPAQTRNELLNLGASVIDVSGPEDASAMFWRYRGLGQNNVDRVIFRDADSRLSEREKVIVEEWMSSSASLHIVRDHPFHTIPILGGLWGIQGKQSLALAANVFERYRRQFGSEYGSDQKFLAQHIYPAFRRDALAHDAFSSFTGENRRRIPARRHGEFIGERITCQGQPDLNLRKELTRVEENLALRIFNKTLAYISRAMVRRELKRLS
jgi:hypothetical protein